MSENRSEWLPDGTWRDPDCIECGGEGAPCCEPPDRPQMSDLPVRVRSARGQPRPDWNLARRCKACGADYLALDAGAATERGIWDGRTGLHWYCSTECAPADVQKSISR